MNPGAAYLNDLEQFTTGKNFWQASLLKQIEGLTMQQALYKPSPDRHGIWQIVRHIAYWKYWALTYLNENKKLNAKEDNWAPMPEVQTEETWQEEIENLRKLNEDCISSAAKLGDEIFNSSDERIVFFRQLSYHDSYHTGQIGFLRAMQGLKPVE
ncbi:MAG: DinB family protein [Ignavibacteria bacterium]|nr:DinB family protein [Ignavibacteria bacterium]HRJ85169.1 DinB family protein [Ignavibacteria bacterium]